MVADRNVPYTTSLYFHWFLQAKNGRFLFACSCDLPACTCDFLPEVVRVYMRSLFRVYMRPPDPSRGCYNLSNLSQLELGTATRLLIFQTPSHNRWPMAVQNSRAWAWLCPPTMATHGRERANQPFCHWISGLYPSDNRSHEPPTSSAVACSSKASSANSMPRCRSWASSVISTFVVGLVTTTHREVHQQKQSKTGDSIE